MLMLLLWMGISIRVYYRLWSALIRVIVLSISLLLLLVILRRHGWQGLLLLLLDQRWWWPWARRRDGWGRRRTRENVFKGALPVMLSPTHVQSSCRAAALSGPLLVLLLLLFLLFLFKSFFKRIPKKTCRLVVKCKRRSQPCSAAS